MGGGNLPLLSACGAQAARPGWEHPGRLRPLADVSRPVLLARRPSVTRRRTLHGAENPLLPRDAGIHRDPPVEVEAASRAGAAVVGIRYQLQQGCVLSGDPKNEFLLFFGELQMDGRFGIAYEIPWDGGPS